MENFQIIINFFVFNKKLLELIGSAVVGVHPSANCQKYRTVSLNIKHDPSLI